MKLIKHGIYYNDTTTEKCNTCDCVYEVKKSDIRSYGKPKKVHFCAWDDCWTEKFDYYTLCPECGQDNYLINEHYDILTTDVIKKVDVGDELN